MNMRYLLLLAAAALLVTSCSKVDPVPAGESSVASSLPAVVLKVEGMQRAEGGQT